MTSDVPRDPSAIESPASETAPTMAGGAARAGVGPGSAALDRGSVAGRYVVLGELGAGAMGVVYAAYDPELDRKVALKVLREDSGAAAGSEGKARLLREAQALAKLSHAHVVSVHDVGTVGDRVWIAMEFVEGQTLREWLDEKPNGWRDVVDTMQQAARVPKASWTRGSSAWAPRGSCPPMRSTIIHARSDGMSFDRLRSF